MPVYEYYCEHCDGVFEALRPISAASQPAACVECSRDAMRIMPTSISMFTFREGYPRRLPDKGTYWHLGKEVKSRIRSPFRPWEHPEVTPPRTRPKKSKGDIEAERDRERARSVEFEHLRKSGARPSEAKLPKKLRKIERKGR